MSKLRASSVVQVRKKEPLTIAESQFDESSSRLFSTFFESLFHLSEIVLVSERSSACPGDSVLHF